MELQQQFEEITLLIKAARQQAFNEVNRRLIELYWEVGKYISTKVANDGWGKSVVEQLADFIHLHASSETGFSARNLWRMKQSYETYRGNEILSPLVTEFSWTNNLLILSGTKTDEEREFYLRLAKREHYIKRELERQLSSGLFEWVALSQKGNYPAISAGQDLKDFGFRDAYLLDFLKLPYGHSEKDLRKSILKNLKDFILVGEEFRVQAGNDDFYVDLLFFTGNYVVSYLSI